MAAVTVDIGEVERFLVSLHGRPVLGLEPLVGGFWSSAFAYSVDERELVLRLGTVPEGFEADRDAMAYAGPDLPVPEVLDVGEALGFAYAISVRHHGGFLEDVAPESADRVGPAIVRLLAALRAVPPLDDQSCRPWRDHLFDGFVDRPASRTTGWRATLAADAGLDRLFRACQAKVGALVDACPERRDLIHGDLLHRNVLVTEDASQVTAVFSWKCSMRGDLLYDVAWCTFWGEWHPGIAAADVWTRVLAEPDRFGPDAMTDAAVRHHCYELNIGAMHLGWNAWTGNAEALHAVAAHTELVLERGPMPQ